MLLDAGADIEATDEPAKMHPLHLAAMTDHPEMAAFLIERGARLEARNSSIGRRSSLRLPTRNSTPPRC